MAVPKITAIKELPSEDAIADIRKKVPSTLYKYRSWQTLFQKAALFEPEIFFSAPSQLNDPFDIRLTYTWDTSEIYHPLFMEKLRSQFPYITRLIPGTRDFETALSNHFENFIKPNPKKWFEQNQEAIRKGNIYDRVGLFCTTENPLDKLMWAYYGNSYQGLCIGYDPVEIWKTVPCEFGKVHYSSDPIRFSFIDEEYAMGRFIDHFLKGSQWQHEDEYRYITYIEKEQDRSVKLAKSTIKEVYIGNRMAKADRNEIINCLKREYSSCVKLFNVIDGNNSTLVAEQVKY